MVSLEKEDGISKFIFNPGVHRPLSLYRPPYDP
ncbi:hypothetical protein T12_16737 [Trichinella patagoniensis]|uniref:Uncharacterized protein n=1 Tax=Trichinella patagoniensis TaxID=990121 RepID=A0A0V0YYD4_9BILA|nr:hypothetical protein T12_16737 [Trichinella patagoniensis]